MESGMNGGEQEGVPCPWCGAAVSVSRKSFPGLGEEGPFLRCGCGGIGLATIEPEAERVMLRVTRSGNDIRPGREQMSTVIE